VATLNREKVAAAVAAITGLTSAQASVLVQEFETTFAGPFAKRLKSLHIKDIIKSKNPYLYRASGIVTCEDLVLRAFNDYVSASVEGYFGPFFESVARIVSGGFKPPGSGEVDLFIQTGDAVRLYVIKSGPKGFNSSSYDKAKRDLDSSEAKLWQDKVKTEKRIAFAYGRRSNTVMKAGIVHLSSRDFWTELSGDEDFYKRLLDACAVMAPLYIADMQAPLGELLQEAHQSFCEDNEINWDKVLRLVSG